MPAASSTAPQRHNAAAALLTQLSIGPAFREVAALLLREQLQERYPHLDINPDIAMVGTATWKIVEDQVLTGPTHYHALTDILERQAVSGVPALYIEGEHFLTQQPIVEPALHLPVRIQDIARILNLLAPVMLRAYQQRQLDFWNQPTGSSAAHWYELADTLRSVWNVEQAPGWSKDDCLIARQVSLAPDLAYRKSQNSYATRAYVLDIDGVDPDGTAHHLDDHLITVLIGKQQEQEIILSYSPLLGYHRYTSLAKLGGQVLDWVDPSKNHTKIQWRLVEPEGDFFDYLACELVTLQIKAIGAIDFATLLDDASDAPLAAPPSTELAGKGPGPQWFQQALPAWLSVAPTSDLIAYSRHMKDLAALNNRNAGASYQDGIVPIRQYAQEQLQAQMLKEHPDATHLMLDRFDIVVQRPVMWGTFVVPGQIETSVFSLVDLALQNLIALPWGSRALRPKGGQDLPDWLTIEYVKNLITQVDIGRTYPALIKTTLLDDPQVSAQRQQLYSQHLRVQLPLLALQCKIRGEAGIDERGYRYVVAVMADEVADRQVDGYPIVIRPLAFSPTRRLDNSQDVVANMFVIAPQDPSAGPCLLYRPLLDQPLSQYPSPSNLLYAIQQSTSLRESVLAWLPDDVRSDYARYVFPGALPSPWAVVDFLVDPLKAWTMGGPIVLGEPPLNGEPLAALFKANANALVELADRQSVSNVEARWASFKHAGWLIFNSTLPFLGGAVGAAAWIWQIMEQLQAVADAQQQPDEQAAWAAFTDLLLNLGVAIALHCVSRNAPRRTGKASTPHAPPRSLLKPVPAVVKLATVAPEQLAENHTRPVHTSGAVNRSPARLGIVLDSFKVEKPAALGDPISTTGPLQHLCQIGHDYYALVGARWFQVRVDENDSVIIVDPKRPGRTGPSLISNRLGAWFVDTRLRLRGGGPKRLISKAQTLAQKRAEMLRKQLSDFEAEKKKAQDELQQAHRAMSEPGPSTSTAAKRRQYLQKLHTQSEDYESALQNLKELNLHAPLPDYPQKALNYVKAQTELTSAGIRETMTEFTPALRSVLDLIERQADEPQDRYIEEAQRMNTLSQEMLTHLEYMQTRFTELQKLAKDGTRLISTTQGTLPAYSVDDLKALQVTMARNLCLPKDTLASLPEAWQTIDQIVDSADVALQCLRDTLREHSDSRLDERIDTLSSLVEQFQLLDERLTDFTEQYADHAIQAPVQGLREQFAAFNRRAISNLALLSAERTILKNRPTPLPTPPRPQKKFIRTRYSGLLIGEPRLSDVGQETGLVDIRSPLTHKVVATYHEKNQGIWVERLKTPPHSPPVVDLLQSIVNGQDLLDTLPAFLQRAETHAAQADRTPIGIEHLYHHRALQLEKAMAAIDTALTRSNATGSSNLSASTVNKALNAAAENLYRQSNVHVEKLLKQRPPTVAAVQWLKSHNAISIKKTQTRRRVKSLRPDYLDEYTISERGTQQVLWYAHFHYSTSWIPAKAYLSARLKTVEEHRVGLAADSPTRLNNAQKTAFYRSEISLEQARQLFFENTELATQP